MYDIARVWGLHPKLSMQLSGAEANAIKSGLDVPRGQGLASRTTSLPQLMRCINSLYDILCFTLHKVMLNNSGFNCKYV